MQWLGKYTLPLSNWVTLVKFVHLSVLQFPCWQNRDSIVPTLQGCSED